MEGTLQDSYPVLQLISYNDAPFQRSRRWPLIHIRSRRDAQFFAKLCGEDLRHFFAFLQAAVIFKGNYDWVIRNRVCFIIDYLDGIPKSYGFGGGSTMHDNWAIFSTVITIEFDDTTPMQKRAFDSVSGRFRQKLIARQVCVVGTVDIIVGHWLVHRALINDRFARSKVVAREDK